MTQEPDRATSGGNGAAVQGAGVGEYRLCFVDGQGAFGGYVKERWGWLCVERINRGEAPWMVQLNYGSLDTDPIRFEIHAGTTLGNFKLIVREAGGHVYEAHPEGGPQ
jgi:hypothetical protein